MARAQAFDYLRANDICRDVATLARDTLSWRPEDHAIDRKLVRFSKALELLAIVRVTFGAS